MNTFNTLFILVIYRNYINLLSSLLYRIVQVAHPSVLSVVQFIVKELNYSEYVIGRIGTGHLGKTKMEGYFAELLKRAENLQ